MAGYLSRDAYRPKKEQGCIDRKYEVSFVASKRKARCTGVELKGVFVSPETINVLNQLTKTKQVSVGQAIDNMVKRQFDVK